MSLASEVHALLIQKQKTLSLAESCTGGALASAFTQIPDCSLYFLGSVVAYSNEAKKTLLGVADQTLVDHGAVSEQVAREMALGCQTRLRSDYALAVTGVAGPSGHPIGRVWFALGTPTALNTWKKDFAGDRGHIISQAVDAALSALLKSLDQL